MKRYIAIKDDIIVKTFLSANGIKDIEKSCKYLNLEYDDIKELDAEKRPKVDTNINEYDDNYDLKPLSVRHKLGFVKLEDWQKIENEKIVKKSLKELIDDGVKKLENYQKYDEETDRIILKTWKERIDEKVNTYDDYLNAIVRPYRDNLLNQADTIYCNPERWYNYTDAQKTAWTKYKQALRDITETKLDIVDNPENIKWPAIPK